MFNPPTGVYDVPFNLQASESIAFEFTFTADITFTNPIAATLTYFGADSTAPPVFALYLNGAFYSVGFSSNNISFTYGDTLVTGANNMGTITGTATILLSNVITTDLITLQGGLAFAANYGYWQDTTANVPVAISTQIDLTALSVKILPSSDILGYGAVINMNNSVPNKVKQADYIKSLFTMYNLYTEQDTDLPNNLVLKHRDDYYDQGAEVDWTYKLAKDKDQALQFLPELSAKKLILTYKKDEDDPNKIYFEATKEIYGQLEFIFNSEYVKGIDTKEITFSPTPIGLSTFNAYLPLLSGQPKTNIRILHDGGAGTCDAYNIYDYGTTGEDNVTTYPILHHWDDPINPTFDILFGQPDYMFYGGYNVTNNNLYNLYWRRTVNQINVGKMLTAYFDLREDDIQRLKLNDKIRIDNSWWTINKVIDYDCNAQNLTKVELMSVDTEIDLAPFKKGSVTPTTVGDLASHTGSIHWDNSFMGNVVPGTSVSAIYGQGNVIQPGVNGIIVGNNKILDQTGIITERIIADVANIKALNLSGGITNPTQKITANYNVTTNDYFLHTSGSVNFYLPKITEQINGQMFVIKTLSTSSTIYPSTLDALDGAVSYTLTAGNSVTLINDGVNDWFKI